MVLQRAGEGGYKEITVEVTLAKQVISSDTQSKNSQKGQQQDQNEQNNNGQDSGSSDSRDDFSDFFRFSSFSRLCFTANFDLSTSVTKAAKRF